MRKKEMFKIIGFIIICLKLFLFFNEKVSVPMNIHKTTVREGIRSNSEIYFVGNSHSYWVYNPLIIDNITKSKSYNIGTSAQAFEESYFIIKKLLEMKETKIIFFETFGISEGTITKKITNSSYIVYDYFPLKEKIKIMSYYFDNKIDILKNIFNYHSYNGSWKNKDFYILNQKENNLEHTLGYTLAKHPAKGYSPSYHRDPSYNQNGYKDIPENYFEKKITIVEEVKISREVEMKLRELLILAKDKNKKIILLSSPFYYQGVSVEDDMKRVNYIEKIAKEYNVKTINFNKLYIELGIKREHFKDSGHMNYYGAIILSNYIGNYILKNFKNILIDNSENKKWKEDNMKYNKTLDKMRMDSEIYKKN